MEQLLEELPLGGASSVPVVVSVVQGIGFGASGIVGGSTAASIMGAQAAAAGGNVVAGGVTATLQAIGATGALSGVLAIAAPVCGAFAGAVLLGLAGYQLCQHKP